MFIGHSKKLIQPRQRRQIEKNLAEIVANLGLNSELLTLLRARNIIPSNLEKSLRKIENDNERNNTFMDYILKQSKESLDEFLQILRNETAPDQGHVAKLFTDESEITGKFPIYMVIQMQMIQKGPIN